MIEKLKRPVKIGGTTFREKINELVDAVNELQKQYDSVCVWVGEQKLKTPADNSENVQDKFAEQRKWIGKVCWFWDDDKKDGSYGVLSYIKEGWESCYVQKGHYFSYKHCEPVSEDLIYKGE